MSNSESILQMTAVSMIRILYPQIVINLSLNGISLTGLSPKVKAQLIAQAKREGMEPGVPDILLYLPESKVLNLEFKRPKGGVQSEEQQKIEQKLKQLNHNYHITRNVNQIFKLIADNTSVKFRMQEFKSIEIPTEEGKLSQSFLHWPIGTDVNVITKALMELYYL